MSLSEDQAPQDDRLSSTPPGQSPQRDPQADLISADDVQFIQAAQVPQITFVQSTMFQDTAKDAVESTLERLQRRMRQLEYEDYLLEKRRHLRTAVTLFLLTFASTFLVGSGYFPLEYLVASIIPRYWSFLQILSNGKPVEDLLYSAVEAGLMYSVPLMLILLCHEMGHYLQSIRYKVPASLPYFIPMPIPPMGTMGAVIFQGQGRATRTQMFDIAVSGPLAGLLITFPVLWYGLKNSRYESISVLSGIEFGEPLIITWLVELLHGPAPTGTMFALNHMAFAGWVGVLITSMNLIPVGQLDGGHILYTLIGRRAHAVAYGVVAIAFAAMYFMQNYSFTLLLILMMLTGIRHPPTANDSEPLGLTRHLIGWLTLGFLIIGFTPNPISVSPRENGPPQPPKVQPIEQPSRGDDVLI
jgi:Zn-dependent protease